MSDTHTWNVNVEVINGSAAFQETSAVVGDTIHADFTWNDAVKIGDVYAQMWIFDPDGMVAATHNETQLPTGSRTLACVATQPGVWRAKIEVWDGSVWLPFEATLTVNGPNMKIEPSSEFFTGPFVAGTTQNVCNVHVKNYGDITAHATVSLWEYPNYSGQAFLESKQALDVAPGETVIVSFDRLIPPDDYWLLGVKAWGTGEQEPSW